MSIFAGTTSFNNSVSVSVQSGEWFKQEKFTIKNYWAMIKVYLWFKWTLKSILQFKESTQERTILEGCTFPKAHIDTTDPVCGSQKKVRTPSSYSGSLVPSTEKAQYYVDRKGEFHPLLQSRYWRVNLERKDKLITDKFIL